MSEANLSYWSVRTNKWTFNNSKIRAWVESKLEGKTLNACCGVCQLTHDEEIIRNDIVESVTLDKDRTINEVEYEKGETVKTNTDTNIPVADLLEVFPENSFQTIIYDPPFSENQREQSYKIGEIESSADRPVYETLHKLLKPGGTILFFGFTSSLMPADYGYSVNEVSLWNLFGGQYDWYGTELQHNPDSHARNSDLVTGMSETVDPNPVEEMIPNATGASGGNDGNSIEFDYYLFKEGTDISEKAHAVIENEISGKTLSLTNENPDFQQRKGLSASSTPIVTNSLDKTVDGDYHYAPQRISDEFREKEFATIFIDPSPEAFQNQLQYYGSSNVEASVLKYESHPLLIDRGRIIQLGRMATCMNGKLPYVREKVIVLSAIDQPLDYIISIDRKKEAPKLGEMTPRSIREKIKNGFHTRETTCSACNTPITDNQELCSNCGRKPGTELHSNSIKSPENPVWHVDCPSCGAYAGNYCMNTHSNEPRLVPHEKRLATVREEHGNAEQSDEETPSIREPPVPFIENDESESSQTLLTGF